MAEAQAFEARLGIRGLLAVPLEVFINPGRALVQVVVRDVASTGGLQRNRRSQDA